MAAAETGDVAREMLEDNRIDAVIIDQSGSTAGQVLSREALEAGLLCTASEEGGEVALVSFASKSNYLGRVPRPLVHETLSSLDGSGSTCTDLGFVELTSRLDAVLGSGASDTRTFGVLLVTDGQMNPRRPLPESVSSLKDALRARGLRLRVHMVTVLVGGAVDQMDVKAVAREAGGDVLAQFQAKEMKDLLWSFRSVSLEGPDHVHFVRVLPRDSKWLAYDKELVFPVSGLPEFLAQTLPEIVAREAREASSAEERELRLTQVVQNLGWLLKAVAERDPEVAATASEPGQKSKLMRVINAMAMAFRGLGSSSSISPAEVSRVLLGTLDDGVIYLAAVKARRRQLFAEAAKFIREDAVAATGMGIGMTLPLRVAAVAGHQDSFVVLEVPSWEIGEKVGERCCAGACVSGRTCAVLPCLADPGSSPDSLGFMEGQCTRQLMRMVAADQYAIDAESDSVVYLYLLLLLQVVSSPELSDRYKTAFRNLVRVLLNKKRTNEVDLTEMAALRSGKPPASSNPNFVLASEEFLRGVLDVAGLHMGMDVAKTPLSPLTWCGPFAWLWATSSSSMRRSRSSETQ